MTNKMNNKIIRYRLLSMPDVDVEIPQEALQKGHDLISTIAGSYDFPDLVRSITNKGSFSDVYSSKKDILGLIIEANYIRNHYDGKGRFDKIGAVILNDDIFLSLGSKYLTNYESEFPLAPVMKAKIKKVRKKLMGNLLHIKRAKRIRMGEEE